jgi:hypothetical protein
MAKLRLYELARELNLTNKDLMNYLSTLKIPVESHMSTLSPEIVSYIRVSIQHSSACGSSKRKAPAVIYKKGLGLESCKESKNPNKPLQQAVPCKSFHRGINKNLMRNFSSVLFSLPDLADELHVDYKVLKRQAEMMGLWDENSIIGQKNEGSVLLRIIYSNPDMSKLAEALDQKSEKLIQIINSYGMRIKTDCVPVDKSLVFRMLKDHPELLSKDIKRKKTTGENAHHLKFDPVKNKTFILDASNICRGFSQKKGAITINYLLSLAIEILGRGGYFVSVFDSNAEYLFREKKSDELEYYIDLISNASDYFYVSTGGLKADEFILQMANEDNYDIISNDRFRDYIAKYPWIDDSPERLNKGKITPKLYNGKTIGYRISIPSLNINADIIKDIENMTKDVISRLN